MVAQGELGIERPELDFGNRPIVSRFHKVAVIIADTGCGLSRGPRRIWEIDQPFRVFKRSWDLQWSPQVEKCEP